MTITAGTQECYKLERAQRAVVKALEAVDPTDMSAVNEALKQCIQDYLEPLGTKFNTPFDTVVEGKTAPYMTYTYTFKPKEQT